MIEIREYDLPDANLSQDTAPESGLLVWVPQFFCIVLGQASELRESLHVAKVEKDQIPVYKRPSGGETVILSPNMMVTSFLKKDEPLRSPKFYFSRYNGKIIDALRGLGVKNLFQRGISDICIYNRKIAGSSIYRSKYALLYHSVLNISEPAANIEKYLKHPLREPDYRGKRPHRDFITSLLNEGYGFSTLDIKAAISSEFYY